VKWVVKKAAFETKMWTYNSIVTAMHRQEIIDLVVRLSESKSGSTPFLNVYKQACALIEKEFLEG
jgi:hypothetical protein